MLKGFKEFISQGNVIDLAIAFIMGAAFKPIVDKVTEVLMAIIGQLIGSPNFDDVGKFSLLSNPTDAADYIYPGTIVTAAINFLLVAAAVYFFMVVPMNKMRARKAVEEVAAPTETELLGEIRDLLASK
ncbi:large conductance mechanosensitive channel protein MscL [Actinomyces vulturis]|uniref:large conductance mechanosensitive channel protein MscL n=1 Tax=Actinomyces vulturis TaxID=1857645 RepID=UPI000834A1FB|nr:large conductance mechanosensitive channel protein MscL [Actinomyces vulturis]